MDSIVRIPLCGFHRADAHRADSIEWILLCELHRENGIVRIALGGLYHVDSFLRIALCRLLRADSICVIDYSISALVSVGY